MARWDRSGGRLGDVDFCGTWKGLVCLDLTVDSEWTRSGRDLGVAGTCNLVGR